MCEWHWGNVNAVREVCFFNMASDACLSLGGCDSWQGMSQ